jgi:hypothetical protein
MHRAERKPQEYLGPHENTKPGVAPGTYEAQGSIKVDVERPVPFASGADKVCCPNLTTSGYTPGPGAYVGQISEEAAAKEANGLGCTALKSKVSRIGPSAPGSTVYTTSTIEKNPGPGTYDRATEWEMALKKPPKHAVLPWRQAGDKTVPSIPMQKTAPNEQPENSMESDIAQSAMRHTGTRGDTVGPGEYEPKNDICLPGQAQTSFARGGAAKDRSLFEPSVAIHNLMPSKENPGPGSYDSKKGMSDPNFIGDAETFQFTSKTQLHHQRKEPNEGLYPGPGQYEITGHTDIVLTSARNHSKSRGDSTRFGSAVQRVGWSRDVYQPFVDAYNVHNVPGPGNYGSLGGSFPDPAKEKVKQAEKAVPGQRKKKYYGVHHPMIVMALQETTGTLDAFGSTDERPCNKQLVQATPAPWSYSKEDARGSSMGADLREKRKIGRNGAFGCLADRFFGSPLAGREGLPDPSSDFETDARYATGAHTEPRAMMISASPRMHSECGPREPRCHKLGNFDTPGPNLYYPEKEISYRSQFRHPKVDHLSFGSGQSRFDIGRDIFDGHTMPVANPSPGEYEWLRPKPSNMGASDTKAKRKLAPPVGSTTEQVGPGSYGGMETHMLKKTFNVSTHAPVTHGKTPRRKQQEAQKQIGGI